MKHQRTYMILAFFVLILVLSVIWCKDKESGMSLFTPMAGRRGGRRSSPGGGGGGRRSPGGRGGGGGGRRSPSGRRGSPGRHHGHGRRHHGHRYRPYYRGWGYGRRYGYPYYGGYNAWYYNRYPWYRYNIYTEPDYGYYEADPEIIYQDAPVYGNYKVTVYSNVNYTGDKYTAQGTIRDANMTILINEMDVGFDIESVQVEGPVSVGFSMSPVADAAVDQITTKSNPDLINDYKSFRIDFPRLV